MIDPTSGLRLTYGQGVADLVFGLLIDRILYFVLGPWRHAVPLALMVMPTIVLPPWTDLGLFRLSLIYTCLPLIFSLGGLDTLRAVEIFTLVVFPRAFCWLFQMPSDHDRKLVLWMAVKGLAHFGAAAIWRRLFNVGFQTFIAGYDNGIDSTIEATVNGTRTVILPHPGSYRFLLDHHVGLPVIAIPTVLLFLSFVIIYASNPLKRARLSLFTGSFAKRRINQEAESKKEQLRAQLIDNEKRTAGLGPYKYCPLPKGHIRLLCLEPLDRTPNENVVHCTLVPTSLSDPATPGSYEAISYRWGDAHQTPITILITDPAAGHQKHMQKKQIAVSSAVYDLLRHLRHKTSSRTIWIDSICINQGDRAEKNIQVGQMTDVYRLASRVVAWLGDDPHEYGGLTHLASVGQGGSGGTVVSRLLERMGLHNTGSAAARTLAGNSWFTRAWMVQEVACAKDVVLLAGRETAGWDDVLRGLLQLRNGGAAMGNVLEGLLDPEMLQTWDAASKGARHAVALGNVRSYYWATVRSGGSPDLGWLMKYSIGVECQVEKDRVYAIMGLAKRVGARPLLEPEYSDTVSSSDVFAEAATLVLEKSLDGLYLCGMGYLVGKSFLSGDAPVPSWVPNWMTRSFKNHVLQGDGYHTATDLAQYVDTKDWKSGTIRIKGTMIDTIIDTAEPWPWPDGDSTSSYTANISLFSRSQALILRESTMAAYSRAVVHRYSLPLLQESLWRTRVCNRSHTAWAVGEHRKPSPSELQSTIDAVAQQAAPGPDAATRTDTSQLLSSWGALGLGIGGRRLAITIEGYLAVVPPFSRVGDKVCVFHGASTPTVLRKESRGDYKVVGSCYVHGIMDGELASELALELNAEIVVLR